MFPSLCVIYLFLPFSSSQLIQLSEHIFTYFSLLLYPVFSFPLYLVNFRIKTCKGKLLYLATRTQITRVFLLLFFWGVIQIGKGGDGYIDLDNGNTKRIANKYITHIYINLSENGSHLS